MVQARANKIDVFERADLAVFIELFLYFSRAFGENREKQEVGRVERGVHELSLIHI